MAGGRTLKIAFLSGAYKNAGDFLIESRCMELLTYFIKDISIDKFLRNEITGKCEELNNYDAIIIGGGSDIREEGRKKSANRRDVGGYKEATNGNRRWVVWQCRQL